MRTPGKTPSPRSSASLRDVLRAASPRRHPAGGAACAAVLALVVVGCVQDSGPRRVELATAAEVLPARGAPAPSTQALSAQAPVAPALSTQAPSSQAPSVHDATTRAGAPGTSGAASALPADAGAATGSTGGVAATSTAPSLPAPSLPAPSKTTQAGLPASAPAGGEPSSPPAAAAAAASAEAAAPPAQAAPAAVPAPQVAGAGLGAAGAGAVTVTSPLSGARLPSWCSVVVTGTGVNAVENTLLWTLTRAGAVVQQGSTEVVDAAGAPVDLGETGTWRVVVDLAPGTYELVVAVPDLSDGEGSTPLPSASRSFTVYS